MTECERFERWAIPEGFSVDRISETIETREFSWYADEETEWAFGAWQARAEIAKQDETEMVEALISVCRKLDTDDITDKRTIAEDELFIQITSVIEKAKGKKWEEFNDS